MFTSRVESRLLLREDNADLRLTEKGYLAGLVPEERWLQVSQKKKMLQEAIVVLRQTRMSFSGITRPAADWLRQPNFPILEIFHVLPKEFPEKVIQQAMIELRYEPYLKRQLAERQLWAELEKIALPESFDYEQLPGLSLEIREKLRHHRPTTLGQASRISGVTPAAISLILYALKKGQYPSSKPSRKIQ
ncbi:MAG: tRNA uridine-5-carboxymethylaminomethyl(34) synthesis enzyme MnmG, partial [Candidatus Omnitrophica bacterium]|nr:tRNA uridine-5-carboxymethylaminomethyl(34) synthesis enzyme MnmG [Candidatus Omnitrophota bacterium]